MRDARREPRSVDWADGQSGIDPATVSVGFDQSVGGRPAGANLIDLAYRTDAGVTLLALPPGFELPLDTLVTMTVTVEDLAGNAASEPVQFFVQSRSDDPPTASFTVAPAGGDAPIEITFDASASTDAGGKLLAWEWYFGDGTTALGRVVSHTYVAGGTYTATLLVRDNEGGVGITTRDVVIGGTPAECTTGDTRPCYSGPDGTAGTGACATGVESCVGGTFGACAGEVVPSAEVCDNGVDDDCDGATDADDTDGCTAPGEDGGPIGGRDAAAGGTDAGPDGVPPIGGGDDGCGCAAPGSSPPGGALVITLFVVALLLRRRRP